MIKILDALLNLLVIVTLVILSIRMIAHTKECEAADLYLGGLSYHANQPSKEFGERLDRFNETNELVGIGIGNYSLLAFKNSYYKDSLAALYSVKLPMSKYVDVLGIGGVATGYEDADLYHLGDKLSVVCYAGFDIHPASKKWGILITGVPLNFVSINFRIKL
jgi:hypothetical protein